PGPRQRKLQPRGMKRKVPFEQRGPTVRRLLNLRDNLLDPLINRRTHVAGSLLPDLLEPAGRPGAELNRESFFSELLIVRILVQGPARLGRSRPVLTGDRAIDGQS